MSFIIHFKSIRKRFLIPFCISFRFTFWFWLWHWKTFLSTFSQFSPNPRLHSQCMPPVPMKEKLNDEKSWVKTITNCRHPFCSVSVYYFPTEDDDEDGPTFKEKALEATMKAIDVFCVWDCCWPWLKFQSAISALVFDPFVELFITLCIVVNTLFMALDHHNMDKDMEKILKSGNYVSIYTRRRHTHTHNQTDTKYILRKFLSLFCHFAFSFRHPFFCSVHFRFSVFSFVHRLMRILESEYGDGKCQREIRLEIASFGSYLFNVHCLCVHFFFLFFLFFSSSRPHLPLRQR